MNARATNLRRRPEPRRQPRAPAPPRRRPLAAVLLLVAAGLVCAGAVFWWLDAALEERHWREFHLAGERAFERGNLDFAEGMYQQALQYAEHEGSRERALLSCTRLQQLYLARNDTAAALRASARAARLRAPARNGSR